MNFVSPSMRFLGTTFFTTFSTTSFFTCPSPTLSLCWAATTTASTRRGLPSSYSTVT